MDLKTMRGPIKAKDWPLDDLQIALEDYDALRQKHSYEDAETMARCIGSGPVQRLIRGLKRLTFRSVCHVATRRSGVCPVYVRGHLSTLTTLAGLFYWNDGNGETRRRLLLLAWKKGVKP